VQALRDQGVPMAVATDWNPGSSPLGSILLAMNMSCTLFGLTPAEALAGTTRNAAKALGLTDCGVIAAERRADLAIWDIDELAELSYRIGVNPLHKRVYGGDL
ncbi:MAG: amidohydrolase family protein, partial [Boseongicola sp.]